MSQMTGFNVGGEHDPYWDNVVILAHMDGTNGSTSFVNEKATTLTVNGAASISTAASKYGGASGSFSSAGSKLIIQNTSYIDLGTGDFTIECFVNTPNPVSGVVAIIGSSYYENQFGILTNKVYFGQIVGSMIAETSTGLVLPNTWHHLALVRSSTTVKIFVDGVSSATGSFSGSYTLNGKYVGNGDNIYDNQQVGYIDELRITKGVARYTTNFTPPTAPFPNS